MNGQINYGLYTRKCYLATENEIVSFARKMDETGYHHAKQSKLNSKGQNSCFLSSVESWI